MYVVYIRTLLKWWQNASKWQWWWLHAHYSTVKIEQAKQWWQWNNGYVTRTKRRRVEHLLGETVCVTNSIVSCVNKIFIVVVMRELIVVRSWSQTVSSIDILWIKGNEGNGGEVYNITKQTLVGLWWLVPWRCRRRRKASKHACQTLVNLHQELEAEVEV